MGELNISFQGVCVSLFGVVPGVAMRVVLPDALSIRYGTVRIPMGLDSSPRDVDYYTMPHIAIIRESLVHGHNYQLTGQYLRVVNAIPQPLCREVGGYSLTQFKEGVQLSANVVFEGNAAAYFDIQGGRVWHEGGLDEPVTTHVSIRTDGTPLVSLSPLPGALSHYERVQPVETETLYVTNLDMQASVEDTQFDFLLNYLVAEWGIPKTLTERTPGMTRQANSVTHAHLGERLKAFGTLIETHGEVKGFHEAQLTGDEPGFLQLAPPSGQGGDIGTLATFTIDPVAMDPSCSTSNYP